jgi:DNA-binding CsgD family transcriptional regulator
MSEPARALLHAAVILGDGSELRLAAALAGLDTAGALSAATALVRSDLLRQENPLEFMHPIVRTAVFEEMAANDRMHAQRRAAELLLKGGAPPEQAATYLLPTLPANDQFVVATLRQAATRSLAQGAPDAAVGYLRRALDEQPPAAERGDVLGELGRAEVRTFEVGAAADHLRDALAELDDVTLRPDLVFAYVHSLTILAERAPEAVVMLKQLTERVRGDNELRERVAARLLIAAHHEPELYAIVRERWPELDQEREGPIRAGSLLAMGAIVEGRRGVDRAHATELARRALAAGIAGSDDALFGFAPLYVLTMAGEVDEAASAYPDAIEVARRGGDRFAAAWMSLFRGRLKAEQGDLLAAEDDLAAPEVLSMSDTPTPLAYRAAFHAEVLVERGQIDEARRLLSEVPLERVHVGHRIHFLGARGRVELESGRADQALASLEEAGAIAESVEIENPAFTQWRSQAALALQWLDRGQEARALATEELNLARRWGAARTVGISLRALGLVEGGAAGEQRLREAVGALAESPARLEHARALIDLGAALRRANSRREARERLRAGIELAHRCGARVLVERANDELAATGAHRRTIFYTGADALTASERRVAQLAAAGSSNKEIAQELFVTVKTVEMHLSRVYRKLEISSRAQLAAALGQPEPEIAAATP